MARVADALSDVDRAGPGEYRRAGITFLLRRVPIGGIGRRPELLDIVRAALGFLKAEHVRLFGIEVIEEVFPQDGAQAVHVPGNQFHRPSLSQRVFRREFQFREARVMATQLDGWDRQPGCARRVLAADRAVTEALTVR